MNQQNNLKPNTGCRIEGIYPETTAIPNGEDPTQAMLTLNHEVPGSSPEVMQIIYKGLLTSMCSKCPLFDQCGPSLVRLPVSKQNAIQFNLLDI